MIRQIDFRAMGCKMMAALDQPSARGAERLQQVPEWFEAWEQSLSRFRADSELSQLNRQAGAAVQVSPTMWDVLQAARQAELCSEGLVTPVVLEALEAAGYAESFDPMAPFPISNRPAATHAPAMLAEVHTEALTRTIWLPQGARLDFGGVAKGWAAQQTMKRLEHYGPALVDAGGDIAVSGSQRDGSPWPIGVADPLHPGENLAVLQVGRRGVATSGRDYRRWKLDGGWQHHIIDPRTGKPAETDVLSATVVALNVMEAEIAAKLVLILGSQAGLAWLEAQPWLAALLVLENGELMYSLRSEQYLWRE